MTVKRESFSNMNTDQTLNIIYKENGILTLTQPWKALSLSFSTYFKNRGLGDVLSVTLFEESNCHLQTENIFIISHEAKKNIMVPMFF